MIRAAAHPKLTSIPPRTMGGSTGRQSTPRTLRLRNYGGEAFVPNHYTPDPAARARIGVIQQQRIDIRKVYLNDLEWYSEEVAECQKSGSETPRYFKEQIELISGKLERY